MSKTPVKRGRPAGMRARQLELKQTLLEHPDVPTVIETVARTALDNTHKNQTAAQKILMDRIFLFCLPFFLNYLALQIVHRNVRGSHHI